MSRMPHRRQIRGRGRREYLMRRLWLLGAAFALMIAGAPALTEGQTLAAATPGHSARQLSTGRALLVCNGSTVKCPASPGTKIYKTVQAAINAARPGD